MLILQKGFNFSQDGPGNRLVYHLQGCNFRCAWCSNADSMPLRNPAAVNYTPAQIEDEALRSRMMFFDGGGVTFTGGEATLQADELTDTLIRLRSHGINTCIETNASSPRLPEIAEHIDCLIMDFKHFDDAVHTRYTGVSNAAVKRNIEFFLRSGRPVHIRIPVINGINAQPRGFADYFAALPCENADFEFLPYHEFGKDKWKGGYTVTDGFVSPAVIAEFEKVFAERGLKTVKT